MVVSIPIPEESMFLIAKILVVSIKIIMGKRIKQASLTECLTSRKPHFGPDLGLLGPNLGQKLFMVDSALLDVRHCPKQQSCVISGKTDATLRNWQKN